MEAEFIILIKGITTEKENFWAYMKMSYEEYQEYLVAKESENFDLASFGEILESGIGDEPPSEIAEEIQETYQLEEGFAEEMQKLHELLTQE